MALNKGLLLKVAGGTVATGGAGTTVFFAIPDKQQTQTANPIGGGNAAVDEVPGEQLGTPDKSTVTGEVPKEVVNDSGENEREREGEDQQLSVGQRSTDSEGVSEVSERQQDAAKGQDHTSHQPDSPREQDSGSEPSQKTATNRGKITTDNTENNQRENSEGLSPSQQDQKDSSQTPEDSADENHSNKASQGTDSKINPSQESSDTTPESAQPQVAGSPTPSLPTETGDSPVSTVVSTPTTTPSSGTVLDSSKISELNQKLNTLQLPERCKFAEGQSGNSFECENITKDELKNIEFENSAGESEIDDEVKGLKLKVEYMDDTKKTNYGNLEENLLFTFSGFENDIEIDDGLNIYKDTDPEFKIENDELKKLWDDEEVTGFGKKVGLEGSSGFCALKVGSTLRFSKNNGETIQQLTSGSDITGKIVCTTRTEDFNQGYKFVFNNDLTIGTETLTKGNYEIKYHESNG